MPKDNINYSDTTIYKIYCKDETITDLYVGYTTNFHVRKYQHKNSCNNSKNNNIKIYKTIRENGGWDNWNMVEIAKYNCKNSTEARIKEQEHYELLKASLNSYSPYIDKQIFFCSTCNLQCDNQKKYNTHMSSILHNKDSLEPKIVNGNDLAKNSNAEVKKLEKNFMKYYCQYCDFKCFYLSDWNRHISTRKHSLSHNGNKMDTEETHFSEKNEPTKYECKCGYKFKTNSGLWKHKNKCLTEDEDNTQFIDGINIKDKDALVLHLLKQNSDLQNKIIDMASKSNITNNNNNTNNNTTNNIDNKTFNLQFFLNETCKDAMNITDFVSSIKLSLEDLENTGRQGYIQGISNIIIKNLNNLEQQLRPLHCSDLKREVLYIKDNNEWTKDSENKPILTKAIKTIANENIKQINKWVQNYPDCVKADSKKNDLYLKIVSNSMNGLTKEEGDKNINKIITNVAKNVVIEK
jgi:hypothetical protein